MEPAGILFDVVRSDADIHQILAIQARNLPSALTPEVMADQGFVSIQHTFDVLSRMNAAAPSVVARAGDAVAGYCLMMPRAFVSDLVQLAPMLEAVNPLPWRGEQLRDNPRWFIIGQIGVAEGHRGRGVFDGMYHHLRTTYRDAYDFVVTNVAARNVRSLRAHKRVGFEILLTQTEATSGEVWHTVVWDFRGAE